MGDFAWKYNFFCTIFLPQNLPTIYTIFYNCIPNIERTRCDWIDRSDPGINPSVTEPEPHVVKITKMSTAVIEFKSTFFKLGWVFSEVLNFNGLKIYFSYFSIEKICW